MKNQLAISGFHWSFDPIREFVQRTIVTPVVEWRRREALRVEMEELDDRTLADMGIARSDIPAIVAGTFNGHKGTVRDRGRGLRVIR